MWPKYVKSLVCIFLIFFPFSFLLPINDYRKLYKNKLHATKQWQSNERQREKNHKYLINVMAAFFCFTPDYFGISATKVHMIDCNANRKVDEEKKRISFVESERARERDREKKMPLTFLLPLARSCSSKKIPSRSPSTEARAHTQMNRERDVLNESFATSYFMHEKFLCLRL